jgi:hypothetical protein
MHAEYRATLRAGPLGNITLNKLIDSIFPDGIQVFERVDAILGPVAFIQMLDKRTWERIAFVAVFESTIPQFFTALDPARQTGLHFLRIITPTTRTVVLLPDIGITQSAVDPTRGDQGWIYRVQRGSSKRDYFASPSSLLMTGPYLARLLPAATDMATANASEISSRVAPALTARP